MVKERVIAYIDGFNLYFGLKQNRFNSLLWLDVCALSAKLLTQNQQLVETKYFTSRVRNNPPKETRQTTYLEALENHTDVKVFYGHYQSRMETCRKCGHSYPYSNEKMTDVNIATELLIDAFKDKYDTALLITGDSDLVPPIKAVRGTFPHKRIVVGFPPMRFNVNVKSNANASFTIGRKSLKDCQLPEEIKKPNGYILRKPEHWV